MADRTARFDVRAGALVARRDLLAGLVSLWPYGIAAAFCSVCGLVFVASLVDGREASMRLFAEPFDLLVVLVTPIVTARGFAEERRSGTAELLLTLPVSPWQVMAAKYVSGVALLAAVLATTAVLPVSLAVVSRPDWGPIFTQYLGALLLVVAFSGVGVTVSLLSASQALVTVVGVSVTLGLWFLGPLANSLGGTGGDWLQTVSPRPHVDSLNRGLVDVADVTFFLAFAVAWLSLGTQLVKVEAFRR